MTVYTYCSYKSSPVGFQIGVFVYDANQKDDTYILQTDKNQMEEFVISAFEDDRIDYVCYGKMPKSESFLILLKKMKFEGEGGFWKQLNLAFLFDSNEKHLFLKMLKYLKLYQKYSNNQDYSAKLQTRKKHQSEMAEKLEQLIEPNPEDGETGITVPASAVHELMQNISSKSEPDWKFENLHIIRMNEPEPLKEPIFQFEKLCSDEIKVVSKRLGNYIVKKKTPPMTYQNSILVLNICELILLTLILLKLLLG